MRGTDWGVGVEGNRGLRELSRGPGWGVVGAGVGRTSGVSQRRLLRWTWGARALCQSWLLSRDPDFETEGACRGLSAPMSLCPVISLWCPPLVQ